MISAEKILIPCSSAYCSASLSTFTSKHNITAYSLALSNIVVAFITSLLKTGPNPMDMTGIFMSFKKSKRASREPKVDACTVTPLPEVSTESNNPVKSSITSSISSSSSSSGPTTNKREPATAFSKSLAAILTPRAAFTSLWCMYSDLIRNSLDGGGVNRALIFVTIGPFIPHNTTRSPSRSNHNKSGTPSPVTAEVGTMETYLAMFLFSKYNSEFNPCSARATLILLYLSWNSD
ncbi:hypothetical protein WICPIJ_007955 [Wickerhamomyces pijperi]|uniref:Uncharacterized protein n=1 Tax=Wickerhamomyces pijperi TaxID=599730 RepID=A0A9P8TJM5_WICPI|nr:hypothetical protein WICPIJ_007955 [Wickerhamomyces pijperi]